MLLRVAQSRNYCFQAFNVVSRGLGELAEQRHFCSKSTKRAVNSYVLAFFSICKMTDKYLVSGG